LSHVLRKTLFEHVNGLFPVGWLNEQSVTKHWFQSVRSCPYSWTTGRNNTILIKVHLAGSQMLCLSAYSTVVHKCLQHLLPKSEIETVKKAVSTLTYEIALQAKRCKGLCNVLPTSVALDIQHCIDCDQY